MLVQLQQRAHRLKLALAARLVEQRAVHVLNGRRLQIEQGLRGLHGLSHRIEKDQAHAALRRQGHHLQFRGKNPGQRAFAPAENGDEVVGA